MPRIPRTFLVDPMEVGVCHSINRCVWRSFLCSDKPIFIKKLKPPFSTKFRALVCGTALAIVSIAGMAVESARCAEPQSVATGNADRGDAETDRMPGGWKSTGVLEAPEAHQAAAADERFVYAITNTQVARYDRSSGKRVGLSTGDARHLNSGFLWDGKLYCAHSNYPQTPEQSEIKVLDLESLQLTTFQDFGNFGGSLTWAVRDAGHWWCNFARYGDQNTRTFLVKFDPAWRELQRWEYPLEIIRELGRNSLSGGIWRDGMLLVTGHDDPVLFRLRLPKAGNVLEFIDKESVPVTGQGIAHDPLTGGLVGINRAKRLVVFASRQTNGDSALSPQPQRYNLAKRASEIDPRAQEHPEIDFRFTDKQGKVLDLEHAAVDTRVKPQGKLVIWLMDHNAGLFDRIAGYGLHGIQVHYANRWFSGLSKEALSDGVSLGRIRLEAATGEDHSPYVAIPRPDGIRERSRQFILWLARENPPGRWEQFLTDDGEDLRWDKVILSGISHGATTAARLAIHQRVDRVVMFSGPRDQTENWQGFPSATPANRFFGYTHILDGGWTADHYCRSWELLGLQQFGGIVDVGDVPPPYGNTRRLVTRADVQRDPQRAHTTVVPGGTAVKDAAGRFIDEPVWQYLFNHPVEQTGSPVPRDPQCRHDLR